MNELKSVNVKIPEDVKKDYEKYCEYRFMTISENLRNHIREELKQWEIIKREKGL